MKVRGIIFDLDGTLLDSIEDIANANNTMLKRYNFPIHPVEKYVDWIGNGAGQLVHMSLPENVANDEQKFSAYLEEYKKEYKQNLIVKSVLYDGILELLEFLTKKDIPLAVNTNKPYEQTVMIADYFLKPYNFRKIQGQMNHVPRKPDPAGAKIIAEDFRLEPSEMVYIGDSIVDVMTSKAAGMPMIGVAWGYGTIDEMKRAGCEHVVSSPVELKTFIEQRI